MTDQQDLRARLLEECDRKENIPTRVPTMNPRTRLVHSDRVRDLLREAAAQLGRVGEIEEDEDGMPVGYADWYNAHYAGQHVDTSRDHACESAWRAALTAQQKAPEGEEECETCEGRGWHDERLGGYSFSNPKAPCPDCDGTGQLSDSAAPGGDVPYDRELIASMLDAAVRGNSGYSPDFMTKQAELLRAADRAIENGAADAMHWIDRYAAGWDAECQLDKVAAALSAPKQVGVSCAGELLDGLSDTFKGDDLQLLSSARSLLDLDKSGALVPHGIGGHARGIIEAFIVRMAYAPQAAPVPVEGEGRRFRGVGHLEETGYIPSGSAAERDGTTCIQDDATDQQLREWSERHGLEGVLSCCDLRAAFEDAQSLCLITPPSQPAVELEKLRPQLVAWIECNTEAAKRSPREADWSNGVAAGVRMALDLIDGAKAGRVDHG